MDVDRTVEDTIADGKDEYVCILREFDEDGGIKVVYIIEVASVITISSSILFIICDNDIWPEIIAI